ncbi:MAG: sulfotransferase [Chloroflexota bacterium]|jgi:hypothetical protein
MNEIDGKLNILGLTPRLQQERPIFIFSSGHRCGSTLLQRLLNSSPDVLIWGEHNGYLNHYIQIYHNLQKWEQKMTHYRGIFLNDGYNNFIANMMPETYELKEAALLHIYGIFGIPALRLGRNIWGFKEVRYGVDVALFLQNLFPRARFIHLVRDISACFLSMRRWELSENNEWLPEWTLASLDNWERICRGFLEEGPQLRNLLSIRFEDMIAEPVQLIEKLGDYLHVPADNFDRNVFVKKISSVNVDGSGDLSSNPKATITEEDRVIINIPERLRLAEAYGYSNQ